MKKVSIILLFFLIGFFSKDACGQTISGIINTYTKVTNINLACNAVTVLSSSGFSANDRILIVQMKVTSANMNQTNSAAFGDLSSVGSAGNYEFAEILGISGASIYFKKALQRTYVPAELVQLVRVPQYTNVTISGLLTAQAWDGNTGGILALEASGTVTFSADIIVSSLGFKGGAKSANGGDCGFVQYFGGPTAAYFYDVATNAVNGGGKGEGIAMFVTGMENGKGKQASGGGGGGNHNNGGGGGANFGAGGTGGNRDGGCYSAYPSEPGVGGLALNTTFYANAINKISLGSGGGGGQQNNLRSHDGGIGGGIVIIRANVFDAQNHSIISKGDSVGYTPIDNGDGNGGGGAGGTVLLDVQNYSSALNIDVRGGAGGNTWDGGGTPLKSFGPGGGGGGGVIWLKNNDAFITSKISGGNSGISMTPSPTPYGATNGGNGMVLTGLVIPESITTFPSPCISLSVELLTFEVTEANARVKITWSTGSEKNNKEFIVERSYDLVHFETVKIIPAAGNAAGYSYETYDLYPYSGTSYYRLSQIDNDGSNVTLGIKAIHSEEKEILKKVYPNPFTNELILETPMTPSLESLKIFNAQGVEITVGLRIDSNTIYLNTSALPAGIYILQMNNGYSIESERIIKVQE